MPNYKEVTFGTYYNDDGELILEFRCPNCGEDVEIFASSPEANPHIDGCDNCDVSLYSTVKLVVEWEKP